MQHPFYTFQRQAKHVPYFLIETGNERKSGLTRDAIFSLYQFIDLIMNLSAELEEELNDEIEKYEEGKKMPIVTSAEKIGMRKGEKEGIRKGIRKGVLESIGDIWEIKFNDSKPELLGQLKQIEDIKILRQAKQDIKNAHTLDEACNYVLSRIAEWQKN